MSKSFLVLFFKKERLPYLGPVTATRIRRRTYAPSVGGQLRPLNLGLVPLAFWRGVLFGRHGGDLGWLWLIEDVDVFVREPLGVT